MITALAMAVSSGFLSLQASMTIAAILTVMLLVIVTVKRSLLLSGMALALIGMTWRSEAWKAAYLEVEAQLKQARQLQPKIGPTKCVASFAYVDRHSAPQFASIQFPFGAGQDVDHRLSTDNPFRQGNHGLNAANYSAAVAARVSDQEASLAASPPLSRNKEQCLPSLPQEIIPTDLASNYHTKASPTANGLRNARHLD